MELIKNILTSNLINKTLLKNCQYYKVRRYNSATTYNLTKAELEAFKQKNEIIYYYITKPSTQKAVKIHNLICDIIALSCFSLALTLLIDILLKTI
tara:strand:- start:32 stop:319 length:288 start_codon:yes stop_codon:yes gene_type:complete